MSDQEIRNDVVETMLRKKITGNKKITVQRIAGYAVASHDEGQAKQLIEDMVSDPDAPVEAYGGGHRDNVRLSSLKAAKKYLRENGRDVPDWF